MSLIVEQVLHSSLFFFTVFYSLLALTVVIGWYKAGNKKNSSFPLNNNTKVSIIIPVRNEEEMIRKCLNAISKQNYPVELIEVIVIDDGSTDKTAEIVKSFPHPNLKLIQLGDSSPKINSYKKMAITNAISISKGDLIVATDGDCWMGQDWIRSIVNEYEQKSSKMISSPVVYAQEKSRFELLQSLEFLYLISLGASLIQNKMGGTCNGANLAYEKEAFYQVGGFTGIDDLASGDDELLLHKMQERFEGKISFLRDESAIVYTHAKSNLREFILQRKRWASKTTHYKDKKMMLTSILFYLYYLLLGICGVIAIFDLGVRSLFITYICIKSIMDLLWIYPVLKFFKRRDLLLFLPALIVVHLFYIIYIGIAGQMNKKYEWKGRIVQ